MSISLLLKGMGVAAATAASAYKNAQKPPTQPTTTQPKQPAYNNESVYNNMYSDTKGDIGTALTNAMNTGASADTVKRMYQDRLSKANGTQYANDSIMNSAMSYINSNSNPYGAQAQADLDARFAALNGQITKANQLSVQQGMNRLNSQKGQINQGYDDAARQAYVASRQAQVALPQQLASQGINGGATETAQLGLATSYQNNLNSINTNRQNAMSDIGMAVTDLQNQGDLNTAEQTLQNNQAALNAYQNMMGNSANYNQWQSKFDYEKSRDVINDTNYASETAYSQKQDEYNRILDNLSMGIITPQDAITLGVPYADVQRIANRYNTMADLDIQGAQADLANQKSITANRLSGGSGSTSTKAPTTVQSTAMNYLNKGDREKAISVLSAVMDEAQIKSFLEQNGFRTDDIEWNIPQQLSESGSAFQPSQPLSPTPLLISYLSSKGLTSEQIAEQLNGNKPLNYLSERLLLK